MPKLIFNGSIGDELNTIPIVKALSRKHNSRVIVNMRFANEIFAKNPFAMPPEFKENQTNIEIPYRLRFARSEELKKHMIDHYANILGIDPIKNRKLELYLDIGDSPSFVIKDAIAVDPKAGWPSRQWPLDSFIRLAWRLEEVGFKVIQVGRDWHDCFGNLLNGKLKNIHYDYTNKLTLRQTAYVLSRCRAYIGPDSACAHIAAAVGIPSFTIYGPIHPDSRKHATTIPIFDGKCTKCNTNAREVCPTDHECMKNITVEQVMRTVMDHLIWSQK